MVAVVFKPTSLPYVTTDLLLNLDAENSSSYSGSGSTWTDLSGNSKHGTLRNSPTFNSSSPKSFTFAKASSQDVRLPLLSATSTNKTVELWVYVTPPQAGCMFESGEGSGFSIGIGSDYYDNSGSNILVLYPLASWNSTGFTYPSTAWYHLVMGLNSFNRFTVWRNGTKIYEDTTQSSKSIVTPRTFSYIASCTGDGPRYYDGKIAVVRFYNKLLNSDEVTQNYNALKSRFGLS
jgi:hypothetical protein